ncbi:MAG: hypothetical protein M0R77_02300 [Gammaproteobacteria bacterium]|nr:hypothetical protein [Gammaproteobacteria bacterium]
MAQLSLKEIRAKLLSNQNKERTSSNDGASYPFWDIPEGETAHLRFLPDGDNSNEYFWREMQKIKLKFSGIKGQSNKPVEIQVPCMEMWGETCPILTEIRPWFKDNQLEDVARSYWKKRSFLFQGFVRVNPIQEQNSPENPIRRFVINKTLYTTIHNGILDPDMEEIPTDYSHGTDFRIVKGKKGQYADYSASSYSRKTSPLTEEELKAIETHGLFNLNDFLPKKPDADTLNAIAEMFQASVDGEQYDPDRWAKFYKPFGLKTDDSATQSSGFTKPADTAGTDDDTPPFDTGTPAVEETVSAPASTTASTVESGKKKTPQEMLAEIAARRAGN